MLRLIEFNLLWTSIHLIDGTNDHGPNHYGHDYSVSGRQLLDTAVSVSYTINSSYYVGFHSSTTYDWYVARNHCLSMGMDLASIHSSEDLANAMIVANTAQSWIGLINDSASNVWSWTDGSGNISQYSNWAGGEPNNRHKEKCGELYWFGRWNNIQCNNTDRNSAWICRKYGIVKIGENEKYYGFYSDNKTSWNDSDKYCMNTFGTNLASINSEEENNLAWETVSINGNINAWIGLTDSAQEGVFEWSDGSPFDNSSYTNWRDGEPNNLNDDYGEDCTHFYNSNEWNDAACPIIELSYFICNVDNPTLSPTNQPSIIPSNQPSMPSNSPSNSPTNQPSIIPSKMPSNMPSNMPSGMPSSTPSKMPSKMPSIEPSSQPTIDYFLLLFNHNNSQHFDILFNSTNEKYNSTNLQHNNSLQNEFVDVLQESSYWIANLDISQIAFKINQIWMYNGSVDNDCQLENQGNNNNEHKFYLSWIRFNVTFSNSRNKQEWTNKLDNIINEFSRRLSQTSKYFSSINNTIFISYCVDRITTTTTTIATTISTTALISQSSGHNSSGTTALESFTTLITICIVCVFICVASCGFIDATFFRRNEIFSITCIASATTYTCDIVSGM